MHTCTPCTRSIRVKFKFWRFSKDNLIFIPNQVFFMRNRVWSLNIKPLRYIHLMSSLTKHVHFAHNILYVKLESLFLKSQRQETLKTLLHIF